MIPPDPDPKKVELALRLLKLGVSNAGVVELLTYPVEVVERQLDYLPARKAKRPSAFIVDAIRNNYSTPNQHRHASHQSPESGPKARLDQNAERPC